MLCGGDYKSDFSRSCSVFSVLVCVDFGRDNLSFITYQSNMKGHLRVLIILVLLCLYKVYKDLKTIIDIGNMSDRVPLFFLLDLHMEKIRLVNVTCNLHQRILL